MKITIHRYGGFAGTSEVLAILNVATLGAESQTATRASLERLQALAREHRPIGTDFMRYELLLEDSKGQQTISFADDGSQTAQKLVELVTQLVKAAEKK
jgi:hypothetical protein